MAVKSPPFDNIGSIYTRIFPQPSTKSRLYLPALYNSKDTGSTSTLKAVNAQDESSLRAFLKSQLDVSRLNLIHDDLWLAGLPQKARPLTYQRMTGRHVVITADADSHLLWQGSILLLKPLPAFLLDYDIWFDHLCQDQALFELANGMLLSYIWLICTECDLTIAHDSGLVSTNVDWPQWTALVASTIGKLCCNQSDAFPINNRYQYGELRLSRINVIYRWSSKTTNLTTMIRGYNYGYRTYQTFFERNTSWLLGAIVYVTVVLTAMQVGLATEQLQTNASFNQASYGFTVFAILAPLGVLSVTGVVVLGLILFNLCYALQMRKKAKAQALGQSGSQP